MGNPGKRRISGFPPVVEGEPRMPRTLTRGARAAWSDYCDVLATRGQLGVDSAPALELLAETQAEVDELQSHVERHGRFYVTVGASGEPMERSRAAYSALKDANRRLLSLLGEFGLTDASRSRVAHVGPSFVV